MRNCKRFEDLLYFLLFPMGIFTLCVLRSTIFFELCDHVVILILKEVYY